MQEKGSLPLLTGFRGIAALAIYNLHMFAWIVPSLQPLLGGFWPLLERGYLAVDFFFVLSGFVLTHVYRDWFRSQVRPQRYREFMLARFGRVYPLHFIASTVLLLVTALAFSSFKPVNYAYDVFLLNSFPRLPALNSVSWSISSEFVAYAFAPLLILLIARRSARGIGGILFLALLWLGFFVFGRWHQLDAHSFFRCLPEFVFGVGCYEIYLRFQLTPRKAAVVFVASVLALPLAQGLIPSRTIGDFICALSFCPLIYSAVQLRGPLVKASDFAFGYLGEISYSLYMIHPLLILSAPALKSLVDGFHFSRTASDLGIYVIMTAMVISCAALTHRLIEVPCRRFFKKLGRTARPEIPNPQVTAVQP